MKKEPQRIIFYVVIDTELLEPNNILALRMTRKSAREYIDSQWGLLGVPKRIRVRRAKGVLFET